MNCIFICVFNQEKYVDMFFLLLESIFIYGNLDENTTILVYTSTTYMNIIKQSHLFNNEKIKFEINDTYDNIDKACKAKLNLFNLSSIKICGTVLAFGTASNSCSLVQSLLTFLSSYSIPFILSKPLA